MINKRKSLITKWLLVPAVLIGFFTLAGIVGQSSLQPQKVQIELVYSNNARSIDGAFGYKLQAARSHSALTRPGLFYCNAISAYNRLFKIKLAQLSRRTVFIGAYCLFQQAKTMPQSSDEDISHSFLG